jgi:hypothetical protein
MGLAKPTSYIEFHGRVKLRSREQMRALIEACPACVVILRELRGALDFCRSIEAFCDPIIAWKLRAVLASEYLYLVSMKGAKKLEQ